MSAEGKAAGQEINSSPVITFVQGQQGTQQEPLEMLLSFFLHNLPSQKQKSCRYSSFYALPLWFYISVSGV